MKNYLYDDLYLLEDTHWWHLSKRKLVLDVLSRISKNKKMKLLDLGCGTGKNLEAFSRYTQVSGIDNSPQAVFYCKKRGFSRVLLAHADALPFKYNSFDIVTMLDVLEHIDEESALAEIKRVLKPNGTLLITVPAYQFLWSQWDEVLGHKRRYTTKSLKRVITKNNFVVKKISYFYSFIVLPAYLIRLVKSKRSSNTYSSDFQLNNSFLNRILYFTSSVERSAMKRMPILFGTSIFCIAENEKK